MRKRSFFKVFLLLLAQACFIIIITAQAATAEIMTYKGYGSIHNDNSITLKITPKSGTLAYPVTGTFHRDKTDYSMIGTYFASTKSVIVKFGDTKVEGAWDSEKSAIVIVTGGEVYYCRKYSGWVIGKRLAGPVKVYANSPAPVSLRYVLATWKHYYIVGEGYCSLWAGRDYGVDSIYRYDTPTIRDGGPLVVWNLLMLLEPNISLGDLIKQDKGEYPPYNPNHRYEALIKGSGQLLKVYIKEGGDYRDNSGYLKVSIYDAVQK